VPSYLPGIFVVLAGLGMIIARAPLALTQYAALRQAHIVRADADTALPVMRRIIIGGSILFIGFGVYLAFNPLIA
jgi:hypothetical protein